MFFDDATPHLGSRHLGQLNEVIPFSVKNFDVVTGSQPQHPMEITGVGGGKTDLIPDELVNRYH